MKNVNIVFDDADHERLTRLKVKLSRETGITGAWLSWNRFILRLAEEYESKQQNKTKD